MYFKVLFFATLLMFALAQEEVEEGEAEPASQLDIGALLGQVKPIIAAIKANKELMALGAAVKPVFTSSQMMKYIQTRNINDFPKTFRRDLKSSICSNPNY